MRDRPQGSDACLDPLGPHDPHNLESPHRCRCLRMPGHYVSNYEPHQCRCGTEWT